LFLTYETFGLSILPKIREAQPLLKMIAANMGLLYHPEVGGLIIPGICNTKDRRRQ